MQLTIRMCFTFGLVMISPISAQTCSCYCGSNAYNTSTSCSSAGSCAIICNSMYALCTNSNTYGCCGTSCTYYSSVIRCNCYCSSTSTGSLHSMGTVSVGQCTTMSCKSTCSSTYWASCGRYINRSYCSHAINHKASIFSILLSFFIFYIYSEMK